MATACGVTVIKKFTYRANSNEEYSNTYWFTGSPPANDTDWLALFNAIVTSEKACYPSTVSVVRGYGYNSDVGHKPGDTGAVAPAVFTRDLVAAAATVPGTLSIGASATLMPGDAAVWCRWKTSRVTSPGGKAIYIRKFFHPASAVTATPDLIGTPQRNSLLAHATKLWDGTLDASSRKITTCGQNDTILGSNASTYVTTRTLKRRGKRPNS